MIDLKFDEDGNAVAKFDKDIQQLKAGEAINLSLPDNGTCLHDYRFNQQTVDACVAAIYKVYSDAELAILKVTRCAKLADIVKIDLTYAEAVMLYNSATKKYVIAKTSRNGFDLELIEDYSQITTQTKLLNMEIEDHLASINGEDTNKFFAVRHFGSQTRKANQFFCAKFAGKQVRVFKKQSDYHVFLAPYDAPDAEALAYKHFAADDFKAFIAKCYRNNASEAMATLRAVELLNPIGSARLAS